MNPPEEPWYSQESPTDDDVEQLWMILFEKIRDEVRARVHSDRYAFLDERTPEDLHMCISSLELQKKDEEEDLENHLREMPLFDEAEEDDEEGEETDEMTEEPENEGGLTLEDSEMSITDKSRLLLCIELRELYRGVVTGGIKDSCYKTIEIEHWLGMKVIQDLTSRQRRKLADILLFQLAQALQNEDLEQDNDNWMNLETIIDIHLDLPNVRKFYREIAGPAHAENEISQDL